MSEKAFSSACILIAEDDESNRKVTSAMLKHLGYRADAVSNGREALLALKRQHYDIILMNLRMPEMDGLEATRLIRGALSSFAPAQDHSSYCFYSSQQQRNMS